jgi:two-component system sensor histidine kinase BaeS
VAARAALKSFAQQALSGAADDAALALEDEKVRKALLALTQAAQGNSSARTAQAKSLAQRAATLALVAAAVGLLVAVLLWSAVLRSLGGPLKDLLAGTERVAQGRFEEMIPVRAGDELGRLATAFNRMAGALGELERMKAEFLATASHGLRTPLACAKGYLSSLASGRQGTISDESRRALMRIEEEIDRVARFVDQLLDLGRLRSGRLPMSMRELPAAAFFASVGRPFEALAEQRGIQYRIQIGEAIPARLTADPDRLSEALINLLGNAFKYTPSGGCVTLSVGGENGWVQVEVADTGPGIPKDEVPLIFEKYFRGGSVTAEGAGLGLAITRGIVERHGGLIWAESAEGAGARFIFKVPVQQPESKLAAAKAVKEGRGIRV